MRVNTNISALIANRQLQRSDNNVGASLERLSSGYRINQSADDVAGMAMSTKLRTQIKGLERSSQNASDGISIVQSAEGALNEVHSMMQRMRELAVQGANDTNNAEDREAIQEEIEALQDEIQRIAKDTEYNTKTLLDGSQDRRSYTSALNDGTAVSGTEVLYASGQVPANDYSIYVTENAENAVMDSIDLSGLFDGNGKVTADAAGKVKFNGYDVTLKEGESLSQVMADIRVAAKKIGAEVTDVSGNTFSIKSYDYGTGVKLTVSSGNAKIAAAFDIDIAGGKESRTVQGKDMVATLEDSTTGERTGFENSAVINCDGMYATITDNAGFEMKIKVDPEEVGDINAGKVLKVNAEVTDIGTLTLHIGANEWQTMEVRIPKIDLEVMGINSLNCLTATGCQNAISAVDGAISYVSSARSLLGACQNRLDAAIASLDTTSENMTEAVSRIMDTDMAEEMTQYTKYNVLSQAGTSMVAQANESPQMVLQLLQ